jgi:Conjugal transfer protein TraD
VQDNTMLNIQDSDAELRALNDKMRSVKARTVEQLGALIVASVPGADGAKTVAGALLAVVASNEVDEKEAWASK